MFSEHHAFNASNVNRAPAEAGVYALHEGQELIYIGRSKGESTSICSRLKDHLAGREEGTSVATTFCFEVCSNPVTREMQLLDNYVAKNGRLPRCNERIG